ncbi:glycosyltransferase family protein [Aureispira anguillae]|uniref:DUF6311 domain-containing protein n=1 Tax=Aureispira anguillae TaxID=2864201 RepID=A0A915YAX8_9BACT|nr:hypothetical protein [Aureispira anguillae]BDS09525.1 hypothetical protein AsAng_0002260 [Aureispira anguillae]
MFQFKKENIYNYLILLLSSVFLFYFYGAVLEAPNEILFSKYGDGFWQYFNFTSYVKHSESYLEHTVSNYPYGEHIVYFDGQPFFGAILHFLVGYFPFLGNYTIGILNGIAMFCIWWTPFLLFGILRRLEVRPILSVWGAIGITFLEPQVFRLLGHFSLSYSCAIPLTVYLLLRIHERKSVIFWTFLLLLSNLIWLYTHPYLGLMCCLLAGSIFFFYWLAYFKTIARNLSYYIVAFSGALSPIVIFQTVIKLTDEHTAKPEDVYGIFNYCGEPDDVFLPNHPPFRPLLETLSGTTFNQTWEGWAYIGITTILTLSIAFILLIVQKIRKRNPTLLQPISPLVTIAFWASVPILFLSWAFPFTHFPELLDYATPLKQFRSLGRFAWVFYYISTLTSIYLIHRAALFLEQKNKKGLAGLLMFLAPLLYMIEGYSAHIEVANIISQCPNYFLEKYQPQVLKEGFKKINFDDYQAILPLPYYYLGSGNYYRTTLGGTTQMAMLAAAHSGIPTASTIVSRGDVWEGRNLIQLVSPPYYEKKIQADFPSKKPFLITRSNNLEKLNAYEQMIFDRARLLSIDEWGYALYEIDFDDLFANDCNLVLDQFDQVRNSLYPKNGWLVKDSTAYLFYEDFEAQTAPHTFRGKGAFSAPKAGSGNIIKVPLPQQTQTETYYIKAWVYNGSIDAMNYFLVMAFGDGIKNLGHARPDNAAVINGDWSLIEFSVNIPPNKYKELHINRYSDLSSNKTVYIDDLLIYTGSGPVYKIINEENNQVNELIYNGHNIVRPQ